MKKLSLNQRIKKLNANISKNRLLIHYSYAQIKRSAITPLGFGIAFVGGFLVGYFFLPEAFMKIKHAAKRVDLKAVGKNVVKYPALGIFNGIMLLTGLSKYVYLLKRLI